MRAGKVMKGVRSRVAAVSMTMAALAAAGCQQARDTATTVAIERATGGQVEVGRDGDRLSLRSPDGAMSIRSGEQVPLPPDFPRDVYLPREYRVNSVMDLQGMSVISLSAPGRPSALYAEARERMQSEGWTQSMAAQHSADTALLAFEKGSGEGQRSAMLSFNRNNGDDRVIVGLQLQRATR